MPTALQTFQSKLGISNPARRGVGYSYAPFTIQQGQQSPGDILYGKIGDRKQSGAELYANYRNDSNARLGTDLVNKSAFQVPTDEFGIPEKQLTNFRSIFDQQLNSIDKRGKLALDTEVAKQQWRQSSALQNLGQYAFSGDVKISNNGASNVSGTVVPGATSDNPGAKAVAYAMQAYKNGTPYVWGGNSLTRGIDCSGLVQQVYAKLGIKLPRSTYEQAKSGKQVSVNQLRPGDLVFYNTYGKDPNGIGKYGHVAIYMGGGKVIEAANSRVDMRISNLTGANGAPALAIRPY